MCAALTALALAFSPALLAGDWLTFGHDPQRTGWAFEETKITPENAAQLALAWKTKLKNEPYSLSALTAPVAASVILDQDYTSLSSSFPLCSDKRSCMLPVEAKGK